MEYVLLIHAAEARYAAMSQQDSASLMQAYGAFTHELMSTGRAGDAAALEGTHTATTVRVRDGKRTIQDGPFAETREQLGGYYSLDAESEEEALAWASKIPDVGTIEVRPVVRMKDVPPARAPDDKLAASKGLKEYLLLIYDAETNWASLSEAERSANTVRYLALSESLRNTGRVLAGERLAFTKTAKSVAVGKGSEAERVVRDGPFAETREQLGGYYRIYARDLDEAIAVATKIPAVETGSIEIRPVMDTSQYA